MIFVKLWQFDPAARTAVRLATGQRRWEAAAERPGMERLALFRDADEDVRLERWAPDTAGPQGCTAWIRIGHLRTMRGLRPG